MTFKAISKFLLRNLSVLTPFQKIQRLLSYFLVRSFLLWSALYLIKDSDILELAPCSCTSSKKILWQKKMPLKLNQTGLRKSRLIKVVCLFLMLWFHSPLAYVLKPEAWFCLKVIFYLYFWENDFHLALENKEHAVCSNKMTWVQNAPKSQAAVAQLHRGKGKRGSLKCIRRKIQDQEYMSLCLPKSSSNSQDSTWKGWSGGRWEKLRQPLSFLGLPVYFKFMIPLILCCVLLGQRFDSFSPHWPRFIFL